MPLILIDRRTLLIFPSAILQRLLRDEIKTCLVEIIRVCTSWSEDFWTWNIFATFYVWVLNECLIKEDETQDYRDRNRISSLITCVAFPDFSDLFVRLNSMILLIKRQMLGKVLFSIQKKCISSIFAEPISN